MRLGSEGVAATLILVLGLPTPSAGTSLNTPSMEIDPDLTETVDLAVADLAFRLERDASAIEVVGAEHVTWPDGSLGCAEPGMMYTQALVDGSRVMLAVDRRTRVFIYHAGWDRQPFLCPSTESDGGHDFVPPPSFST
jgi:hypothetical protein